MGGATAAMVHSCEPRTSVFPIYLFTCLFFAVVACNKIFFQRIRRVNVKFKSLILLAYLQFYNRKSRKMTRRTKSVANDICDLGQIM